MNIISKISSWWLDTNLKTRLTVLLILTISLVMSGLTFWALTTIQEDSIIYDNRFCKDLGILLASNLLEFIENNDYKELASFVEKIYLSTSSIRYILLFYADGTLFLALPVYSDKVQNLLQLHKNLFQLETQDLLFGVPLLKAISIFDDNITDVIIPLSKSGKNFGSLNLGINSNTHFSSNSKLIMDISIATFVSIWSMFLMGVTFSTLTMEEPIKQLLQGIKNIASGNFSQKIILPLEGELGNLITSFNTMMEKLESYEKKNVDELILEKMKLETIVSTITEGVILIDAELRFLFVNQIAIQSFHWSNLDIIGKSIFDHFPMHVNKSLLPILNDFVKSNYVYKKDCKTRELKINFDYNSNKVLRFLLTTALDYNDMLASVTIVIQDISQEVELNKAKHQFIANVSHELRTPLCNIGSFLETLLDYHNTLNNQQKIRFLRIANSETRRLSALVNDILDLSQLESGYTYNLVPVNIMSMIDDIVQSYHIVANYNSISLIKELDIHVKFVYAHESSLLQVFANLISNAIKFTSPNGQVIVRTYFVGSNNQLVDLKKIYDDGKSRLVRIEIVDEGIGIDKRNHAKVFDRFVRIENNIHSLEGTGLGLSIVANVLNKHDTQIFLYSEPLVGTSLWFDLWHVD